jgi:hypothetical protein
MKSVILNWTLKIIPKRIIKDFSELKLNLSNFEPIKKSLKVR